MSFHEHERKRLAELADVLIPSAAGSLSASEADVGGKGLDQFLATCPEMDSGLRQLLLKAGDDPALVAVAKLRQADPAAFGVLAEFAAGAYFLNPAVCRNLGYVWQTARPIDPAPDYLSDGLLESVIQRVPIYRPTPK